MNEKVIRNSVFLTISIFIPLIISTLIVNEFLGFASYLLVLVFAYFFSRKLFYPVKAFFVSLIIAIITWVLLFMTGLVYTFSNTHPALGLSFLSFFNLLIITLVFSSFSNKDLNKMAVKSNKKVTKNIVFRYLYILLLDLIILIPIVLAAYIRTFHKNLDLLNINLIILAFVTITALVLYFTLRRTLNMKSALSMLIIIPVSQVVYILSLVPLVIFSLFLLGNFFFLNSGFILVDVIFCVFIGFIFLIPHILFINFIMRKFEKSS